jgi:hypothetical protein
LCDTWRSLYKGGKGITAIPKSNSLQGAILYTTGGAKQMKNNWSFTKLV